MYEYAANGSLDKFLMNDKKRADLSAVMRLSIMYGVAKAVHFLHAEVKGWKVFHRDIKSANICLTEDFTPRLIDCGLATFVEKKHYATPSETIMHSGSTVGPAVGTHMYMCPEYNSKKGYQGKCDYTPAYDVYSFGVVMAELILGRLNDGKDTKVLQTYVLDEEAPIDGGWEKLKKHADSHAGWNSDALNLVCKTAIGCLILISHGRLSTDKLLDLLEHVSNIHTGKSGDVPEDAIAALDKILLSIGKRNSKSEGAGLGSCMECDTSSGGNRRSAVVTCSKGHALCDHCLEKAMMEDGATNDDRLLPCLIAGCTSLRFEKRDLFRKVAHEVYQYFFVEPLIERMDNGQRRIASVIDRHSPGLTSVIENAQQSPTCPTKVEVIPIAKECPANFQTQQYEVFFYSEDSNPNVRGHDEPFEISVDHEWIVQVADFLRNLFKWIKALSNFDHTKVLSAVSSIPVPEHSKEMRALIKALGNKANHDKILTLEGNALKAMAEIANKEENSATWKKSMVAVVGTNVRTIWVRKEFESKYPLQPTEDLHSTSTTVVDVTSHE